MLGTFFLGRFRRFLVFFHDPGKVAQLLVRQMPRQ